MRKVIQDGTLGISEMDRFVEPAVMRWDLNCSGGDDDAAERQVVDEDYYFE